MSFSEATFYSKQLAATSNKLNSRLTHKKIENEEACILLHDIKQLCDTLGRILCTTPQIYSPCLHEQSPEPLESYHSANNNE